jgi:flagellar secretion chaperone FliS
VSTAARAAYRQVAVETASSSRLVVMLYERLARDIAEGEQAVREGRFFTANSVLLHAQEIVLALHTFLDTSAWSAGKDLAKLYDWFYEQLVNANLTKSVDPLVAIGPMVHSLLDAWRQAANSPMDAIALS